MQRHILLLVAGHILTCSWSQFEPL